MSEPTATPLSHSTELALTGQLDVKNKYGSGQIRPERVVFYYLTDRTNAHLHGSWVREDGEATDAPLDQLYRHDDDWPDWLITLARKHAPGAVEPPTNPTHGLSVQHADALWDAVAIPGPRTPTFPEQHERVCRAVAGIIDEVTAVGVEVEELPLRDRIAALAEDLRYVLSDTGPRHDHERPGVWDTSGKPCTHCARLAVARQNLAAYDAGPDAAVLPPPVSRADVLREAANSLACLGPEDSLVSGPTAWTEAVETLRRMADEAQPGKRRCTCSHPADEHSIYGCADDCACEWMPKRRKRSPMSPWRILGIDACPTPLTHNWGCGCPGDQLPLHAESGVDTPGCDCGHDGMGPKWHLKACAWVATLDAPHPDEVADEAQPEGEPGCAHCGGDHSWDDCEAYTALVADEAQPGTEAPAVTVHACPGLDDNGISPCCKRPPFEFRGERLTRDPALVTCPGPAAGAQQDGAQR